MFDECDSRCLLPRDLSRLYMVGKGNGFVQTKTPAVSVDLVEVVVVLDQIPQKPAIIKSVFLLHQICP